MWLSSNMYDWQIQVPEIYLFLKEQTNLPITEGNSFYANLMGK